MADVIKKATRDSYGAALVELAVVYPDLVVLDAERDVGCKVFVEKSPNGEPCFDVTHGRVLADES